MWFIGSLIFLLLLLTLVFSFPSVQTAAAKKGVSWVNNRYGTDIKLERLRYVFPDQVVLQEIFIRDEQKDTMLYAGLLKVGVSGFVNNTLYSTGAEIEKLRFYYIKKPGASDYNFKLFSDRFSSGDTSAKKPFGLELGEVSIADGRFTYLDMNCDSCFDFSLYQMQIDLGSFELDGHYFTSDINSLSAKARDAFDIKSLATNLSYLEEGLYLENLDLTTSGSHLVGDVLMKYDSIAAMKDFVNQINLEAELTEGSISSTEIRHFSSAFPDFQHFQLTGQVQGPVNNMYGQDLVVKVGTNTTVRGDLHLRNTTYTDSLFMQSEQLQLWTNPDDMRFVYGLFSDSALPKLIDPLGNIQLQGKFKGYLDDFSTSVNLQSGLGGLQADLDLEIPSNPAEMKYQGEVVLEQFDLGSLVDNEELGKVSTHMAVDGAGLDPTTMNTRLEGDIALVEYNQYPYQNIEVDGRIQRSQFKGNLNIDDPNLVFDFKGEASFGKDTSRYDFYAEIKKADLYRLNFSKDSISSLTAKADIDMEALNFSRWAGDIRFYDLTYENSQNFHFFQDINVHGEGLGENRLLEVKSNIVNATLQGDYSLEGMTQAVNAHISKFLKTREPVPAPDDQNFTFDVAINNTKVLTEIFIPELEIDPGTHLSGNYSSDTNTFLVDVLSPGFEYKEHRVSSIDLEYDGGPRRSQLSFDVASFEAGNGVKIDSIKLGNYYYQDTLNFDLSWIMRDSIDSRGNLQGYALQEDSVDFEMGFYQSGFNIGFENFDIAGGNRVFIDTGGIEIQDFVITNEGRSLTINGNISDNPNEILRVNLRGFGVDLANYFIGTPSARFNGELYGDIILTQLLGKPKFAANLQIDSLEMNSTLLGSLNVVSDWSVEDDTISLKSTMKLGDLTTFTGEGYYQPDSLGNIYMDLDFDRFRLAAFNPLVSGIAENLRGSLTGQVKVRGNTGAPKVTGEVQLPKTAFTLSFLQTDYNIVGTPTVKILEDRIAFPDLTLRDTRFGTEGSLTGKITHNSFRDFNLNLDIDADELLVLNTTSASNDPYYGTAFVSGNIGIDGPTDEIKITANLTTKRDTRFNIPIGGATEVNKTDFVTFVNPNKPDSLLVEKVSRLSLDKGVSLDFSLNVNQNAELGIVIDEDAGNQIVATGSGTIRIKVDAYSDIEIYGSYTVADGYYNFVFQDYIQRKFDILRGGTVTWNGDPFGAIININARYSTKADPSVLVVGYSGGKTVVYVDLLVSGELMNPDISFDIVAPRAAGNVQSALGSRLADDDSRQQQVFALLTLGRFINDEGLTSDARNIAGLKFLAGQAEGFLNQFTGDYRITLDYESSSYGQATDNTNPNDPVYSQEVEVGLSKDFFDDRVTINGSVGVPVRQAGTRNQIAGDFEIEYDVTEDGRLRAKIFNRSVQQYTFGQQNYQQGVGVFYRVDFEGWDDFLKQVFNPPAKTDGTKPDEDEAGEKIPTTGTPGEEGGEGDAPVKNGR